MAGFDKDVLPDGEDQPGDLSKNGHKMVAVGFLRSVGFVGGLLSGLFFAGLGIAFGVAGLVALGNAMGPAALSLFAFSIFFFLPLAMFLRKPKSQREHPRGTSDISKDWRERAAMAADPTTPIDVLGRLAGDPMTAVRMAVITNPSTPMRVVEVLRNDPSPGVKREAELRRS